jgi:putative zinc finger/helix-turn-helix YgiT family protein
MEKVICFECGKTNDYELRKSKRKYKGDGYEFELDVEVPFCKNCGALITIEEIESEITKKANEKIRESRGIVKREEIIDILSKYNVSQKFLSRLLGWGEITLTRYISGGYTPNKVNSDKLK